MKRSEDMCLTVQSIARGDDRDDDDVARHLELCTECRESIDDIRSLAHLAQVALEPTGEVRVAETAARLARERPAFSWLGPVTAAAAAVAIAVVLSQPAAEPEPQIGPIVVLDPPVDDRLPYVIRGPQGSHRGQLDMKPHYVLDSIPADRVYRETF